MGLQLAVAFSSTISPPRRKWLTPSNALIVSVCQKR